MAEIKGTHQERVNIALQYTKNLLKRSLDVDDLSLIEQIRLRQIVKPCLERDDREQELVWAGQMRSDRAIDGIEEAMWEWLFELYGIRRYDMDRITSEFKEYLRRLRARAHMPEL